MLTEKPWQMFLLLLASSSVAMAQVPEEAEFILQQQADTPFQVLHPNPRRHAQPWIHVSLPGQTLTLYDAAGHLQQRYQISTARLGAGEQSGSYQTPRGWHQVCEKIGDGATDDTIIFHRRITPWHYSATLHASYPDKDWILARILWLCGQEPGKNQGGEVDSHDRAIYIHGAGAHVKFGTPTSRGCVRMQTADVVTLYPMVELGTDVLIDESP